MVDESAPTTYARSREGVLWRIGVYSQRRRVSQRCLSSKNYILSTHRLVFSPTSELKAQDYGVLCAFGLQAGESSFVAHLQVVRILGGKGAKGANGDACAWEVKHDGPLKRRTRRRSARHEGESLCHGATQSSGAGVAQAQSCARWLRVVVSGRRWPTQNGILMVLERATPQSTCDTADTQA